MMAKGAVFNQKPKQVAAMEALRAGQSGVGVEYKTQAEAAAAQAKQSTEKKGA